MEAGRRELWGEMRGGLGSGMFIEWWWYVRWRKRGMIRLVGVDMDARSAASEINDVYDHKLYRDDYTSCLSTDFHVEAA